MEGIEKQNSYCLGFSSYLAAEKRNVTAGRFAYVIV